MLIVCRPGVQLLLCIVPSSTSYIVLMARYADFALWLSHHLLVVLYIYSKKSRVEQVRVAVLTGM